MFIEMKMPPTDDDVTIWMKWMHITYWANPLCLFIELDAGSITSKNKYINILELYFCVW
jgi:hypothetical protein